jgi:GNAT superfamily N-acetyltransferase
MNRFEVVAYAPRFRHTFAELWVPWLEAMTGKAPEPEDLLAVGDPEAFYIARGGAVFFATRGGAPIGVVAVKNLSCGVYEFCKLVVLDAARGLGVGRRLVEECIAFARQEDGRLLTLQSLKRLEIALGLYQQMGFKPIVPPAEMLVLARTEVVMGLELEPLSTVRQSPGPGPGGIRIARTAVDFEAFARLLSEYIEWCRARYQDNAWLIDQVFGYQSLALERASLSTAYAPPNGQTLLAIRDGMVCGVGAYRRLDDGACEMKRLFVRDRCQGQGLGRRLCAAIIAAARDEGYRMMRLDTGTRFVEAQAMYRSFGFQPCPPYHDYPPALMPDLVFMELPLVDPPTAAAAP